MGVPAFFRWLSRKYASIVVPCQEDKAQTIDGYQVPVDATQPNPNDVEFDNLYLDMNGIIHPCCHPEDKPAPKDEDEMMVAIFEYIDRIFNIVRPRRLLYMAIDGVAPRAKMNQQRSRRFRASKETSEKHDEIMRIREDLESRGCQLPPIKPKASHFDSNCITPGTEFMARLAVCLQYYIHDRMNTNPAWQSISVILSDANVPGEGEHKIMDFIRRQRGQPDHDPNTHHCLYGADADLIMLGLATHEPYFTILREEFKPGQPKPCEICGQIGHVMKECTGEAKEKEGEFDEMANSGGMAQKDFIFIRLPVLREYLERELRIDGLPFPFDLERAIDDWVFMCFFVGNDFLPHLPSLEIREGAIDRLIRLYKKVVPQTHGYLTHNGKVNLPRVQLILTELGKVEDEIFKNRRQNEKEFRRRQKQKKRRTMGYSPKWTPQGQFAPTPVGSSPSPIHNPRQEAYQMRMASSLSTNQSAASSLKDQLKRSSTGGAGGGGGGAGESSDGAGASYQPHHQRSMSLPGGAPNGDLPSALGRKRPRDNDDSDSEPEDNVRLWEQGWKERYYNNKFGVPSDDDEFICSLAEQYTRGLCWVLGYYYQGCPSWKWFYPYHYAPFASDFKNITRVRNDFDRGTTPFAPLEQLMGVFPASSGKFLPLSWRQLMMRDDSPIIDFYPTNFKVDLNGKKWAWQGVALLPFVDERRLLQALSSVYPNLTAYESERNSLGSDRIFVYRYNRLYPVFKMLYENRDSQEQSVEMNPDLAHGLRGTLSTDRRMVRVCDLGGTVESPVPSLKDIKKSYAICSCFRDPHYPDDYIFEAKLLPSVTMPPRTLKGRGVLGPYQPQIGFSQREGPHRSYSTPQPASRMIRHSLGGSDAGSPHQSSGGERERGGEYYSSQGETHGFRGLAPSPSSAYGGGGYYNSPSHSGNSYNSWARDQPQNVYYRQGEGGGGGEMGWNSSSPYEQEQRRSRSSGGASGYPASPGGGQSSWNYSGGYDEQWSGQQSPWRRQSGPSPSRWSALPSPSGPSHSPHYATPPSHGGVFGDDRQSFLPPPPSHSQARSNPAPYQYDQRSKRDSYHYN